MKFRSTRGAAETLAISDAMISGLAGDGGLFVPESLPQINPEDFIQLESFPEIAAAALAPFFSGDPLGNQLPDICNRAFNFPLTLKRLFAAPGNGTDLGVETARWAVWENPVAINHPGRRPTGASLPEKGNDTGLLELFHGPTCAFKDFGARFLAECFTRMAPGERRTILVATSGDTGGAVAAAFHCKPNIEVGILYPDGHVSARQEKQLTGWGGNVRAFAVAGTFDDCQRIVKDAFADRAWSEPRGLTSANSINIGRLLPQIAYFGAASLWHQRRTGARPSFIIPAGNLGNGLGAFYAKRMGFPIERIALASNANRTIPDYFSSGNYQPRTSIATLANAMDVGAPSNLERLRELYPDIDDLRRNAISMSVDDAQIRAAILRVLSHWGEIVCPHTATAFHAREQLPSPHWIIAATAHPAKFESLIEPLIGRPVPVPPQLAEILGRPGHHERIGATLADFQREWG